MILKVGAMILKVYTYIYIVLLIVYPLFGEQSLLAPLIMPGLVGVLKCKSFKIFKLRKECLPLLRTQALQMCI